MTCVRRIRNFYTYRHGICTHITIEHTAGDADYQPTNAYENVKFTIFGSLERLLCYLLKYYGLHANQEP